MVAVRIGPDWRLVAVASPGYFAAHPVPEHPRELIAHNCINIRQATAGGLYAWEFEKRGQELRVRVDGQLTFNTSYAQVEAAVAGYGIAYVPEDLVEKHVTEGRAAQGARGLVPAVPRVSSILPEPTPELSRIQRHCRRPPTPEGVRGTRVAERLSLGIMVPPGIAHFRLYAWTVREHLAVAVP